MTTGRQIGGYALERDFTTAGGGRCQWAPARQDGVRVFLKQFLAPKYPTADAPGSERGKAARREACARFEARHRDIVARLDRRVGEGGNVVRPLAFFREETTYYKVTEWVDTTSVAQAEIAALPPARRLQVLLTLAHSVRTLHGLGLVHGDLKPANVLVKHTASDHLSAKLIDLDEAFVDGRPPGVEELVGDQVYCAPETLAYLGAAEEDVVRGPRLGAAVDVFALGLMVHEYWCGTLPGTGEHSYACERIAAGAPVQLDPSLPAPLAALVGAILARNPSVRPDATQVFERLRALRGPCAAAPGAAPGRLVIRMGGVSAASAPATPGVPSDAPVAPVAPSKLVIRMGARKAT